jgi:hypothetical protein
MNDIDWCKQVHKVIRSDKTYELTVVYLHEISCGGSVYAPSRLVESWPGYLELIKNK